MVNYDHLVKKMTNFHQMSSCEDQNPRKMVMKKNCWCLGRQWSRDVLKLQGWELMEKDGRLEQDEDLLVVQ